METRRAVLAGVLVLAVSTAAMGITFSEDWIGPIVIKLTDKGSGVNWQGMGPGYVGPPGAIVPPGTGIVPGTGTAGPGEMFPGESWGVFRVTSIWRGQISPSTGTIGAMGSTALWSSGGGGQELVGMFWGIQDIALSIDPGSGTQTIESVGMQVGMWEQNVGTFTDAMFNAGSSGRVNLTTYNGIGNIPAGNPNLWLSAVSVPGYLGSLLPGLTEYVSTFNPQVPLGTAAGGAEAYLSLGPNAAGTGSFNDALDSDYFGSPADLYINIATDLNNANNDPWPLNPNQDDFTVWSNDDTTGIVVPEPMTVMAVFLGLGGLGGYVRRRTRVE